jgi:hypothetical protein
MQQDIPPPPELPGIIVSSQSGAAPTSGNGFLRFLLGLGIGSLPAPLVFLIPTNAALTAGVICWCSFFVVAIILLANRRGRFIGLGMLIAAFITPIITIGALVVLFVKSF